LRRKQKARGSSGGIPTYQEKQMKAWINQLACSIMKVIRTNEADNKK
jgi:hypothetical protein